MLGFNLCGRHLESLSLNLCFVNEVRLDNEAYTGGLESQLTCGPASLFLPGISSQLCIPLNPRALVSPSCPLPIPAPQLPSAPGGGLSINMGRVGVQHVPTLHLREGQSSGCPHPRLAGPQTFSRNLDMGL